MRQKRIVQVPATTREREIIHCDGCGAPSVTSLDWNDEQYRIASTTVEMCVGDNYPEGASYQRTTFDLCPACFETKLVPALVALFGAQPHVEDCH